MKKNLIIASLFAAVLSLASCGNVVESIPAENIAHVAHSNAVTTEAPVETTSAEPEESIPEDSSAMEQDSSAQDAEITEENTGSSSDSVDAYVPETEIPAPKSDNAAAAEEIDNEPAYEQPENDADAAAVDVDEVNGSIDALNTMLYIAKGGYADLTVWYDADFNVTDNKDELMYYAIPEEYKETCENASMMMHSGHFTRGFISSLGLDDISDRFVENDGTLYFPADRFTAYRAEYYRLLDEEIHMEGNDRFFVYVTEGHGVYSLSFVYEPVITVYTSIWKMDSKTLEGPLY